MKNTFSSKNGLNADLRSIDSIYRMIVVAGLRSKQLLRGASPKIVADPTRVRNISIALEEARRGLITYTIRKKSDAATPPPSLVGVNSTTEVKELIA
jgi:DNA-directed RNA polymerase subunit K/omega